jgi:hypothetical protein
MTKQEHCTTLFMLGLYYWFVEGDRLNSDAAFREAVAVAHYPWYNERVA